MAITGAVMIAAELARSTAADERVAATERRLYDAEVALHIAHQTHVDEWIASAADRLHAAIIEHTAAVHAAEYH
ncbi:MAG: hypothetical protein JWO57_44 [Pseudonocardiales bacterium]|jgi:hypothetical protein|nr:hypothetical protein [Pseudonocardiales bacterium]